MVPFNIAAANYKLSFATALVSLTITGSLDESSRVGDDPPSGDESSSLGDSCGNESSPQEDVGAIDDLSITPTVAVATNNDSLLATAVVKSIIALPLDNSSRGDDLLASSSIRC